MGIRLTAMRIIQIGTLVIIMLSCATNGLKVNKQNKSQYSGLTGDQKYIYQEFKNNYFKNCLMLGYGYILSEEFLEIDISFAGDFPLGNKGMKVVDSLAQIQKEKITQDSLHYLHDIMLDDPYYVGKKRVLQLCLQGYESLTIDSMAIIWAKKLAPND